MSGPSKVGEPSMEEILASIRKIIADDPSKQVPELTKSPTLSAPAPAVTTTPSDKGSSPLEPSAKSADTPTARPSPSFGRLSEALRTTFASSDGSSSGLGSSAGFSGASFGSTTPGLPLGSAPARETASQPAPETPTIAVFKGSNERARSIDNELDELLNDPLTSSQTPVLNDAVQSGGQWAVWRTSSSKPADNGSGATAPTPDAASVTAKPDASASPSLGRPSGGFYPASGATPPPAKPSSPFSASPRFDPPLQAGTPSSSGFDALASKREGDASGGDAAQSPSRSQPLLGSDTADATAAKPFGTSAPSGEPRPASKPAPVVIAAMPAAAKSPSVPPAVAAPEAPKDTAKPMAASEPVRAEPPAAPPPESSISVPLPPRTALFSRPFSVPQREPAPAPSVIPPSDRLRSTGGSLTPPSPPKQTAPPPYSPVAPAPVYPSAAPASPLDALAAGLAASNVGAAPAHPAAPNVPASVPVAAEPASAAPGGAAGPRTLEDMVADMVKPMLQKWLTDNMPRIIEKALRSETGLGPKPPNS